MAALGEAHFLGDRARDLEVPRADPRDRFMSGLPAHLTARALGLTAGAFCLDAACASSLYAIRVACDWLREGRADVMLAGAVNRADNLFLHAGFTALTALSPTGRSRPFHKDADGLVPGEGAGVLALMRLDDAVRQDKPVLGVIRGVGLSNDGRARNLLAPARSGQARAIRAAWTMSGLEPTTASLIECHATGTPTGDGVELGSMRDVFGDHPLTLGSLKSNLGHLITAAGVAGVQKVLGALAHETLPPTLHAEAPLDALRESPFRALAEAAPWEHDPAAPRRAGVSAFGFGGNNAHLILEEARDIASAQTSAPPPPEPLAGERSSLERPKVAVVGLGLRVGTCAAPAELRAALTGGDPIPASDTASVDLDGLRFPPNDLKASLPQQLLVFEAARDALDGRTLDAERAGVLVGMGCDVDVTTPGARWRLDGWADALAPGAGPDWVAAAKDAACPRVDAAAVLGQMPNIPANRLNLQHDLRGFGFTVSSEELSGLAALDTAARWLRDGDVDAAVVGAVDVCRDPRHTRALASVYGDEVAHAQDAAVVLVVKTERRARADGDPIYGLLDELTLSSAHEPEAPGVDEHARVLGHAHAAKGLLEVAAALALAGDERRARVRVTGLGGARAELRVTVPADAAPLLPNRARGPSFEVPTLRVLGPIPPPPAPEAQRMAPAPRLPSVHALPPTIAQASNRPRAPSTALAEQLQDLARAHAAYLKAQGEAHRAFLEARARAIRSLHGSPPPPAPPAAPSPPPRTEAAQPLWDRAALEHLASKNISDIFGPLFARQDDFPRQVRMPEPPLLLCDRVMSIDAEPGVLRPHTTIVTESDVEWTDWYLHDGHVPASILIESGQADLLLISYMGVDFENAGERSYRLLGCDLSYAGGLPPAGSLLHYDIHVDGFATHGDTRIFFFHSDCRLGGPDGEVVLSVRNGQAGFFTDEELDDSGGVLWSPEDAESDASVDAPVVPTTRAALSRADLEAWAAGDLHACFGPGFEAALPHVRTPRPPAGDMLLVDRVTHLDPTGGPLGKGYLRAELDLTGDNWFYDGHFKDDPCMPGTLMFEGCLQSLSVYLAGLGFTLDKDGHRFEPAPDEVYKLRCRGQATPRSRELVYEVFVRELRGGPEPTITADILVTVDGLKALICHETTLKLVVDYPLSSQPALLGASPKPSGVDAVGGVGRDVPTSAFDQRQLLATGWGAPSEAFGDLYAHLDGPGRHARLPGPPYHFMSRVRSVDGPPMGEMSAGGTVVVDYDVPPDAWFFDPREASGPAMPFAVLLEVALQPCGWLSTYVGSINHGEDLAYRNLDGDAVLHRQVGPDVGTLTTRATLTDVSSSGGMIIQRFALKVEDARGVIFEGTTAFGFFPPAALANQVGLPTDDRARARLVERGPAADDAPALAGEMLQMIDRVEAYWPEGGSAGLGFARAAKDIDPSEWFFKAHFFQDPVQPGSLGVEAMIQTLKWVMQQRGIDGDLEPLASEAPVKWTYRGQVIPSNTTVHVEVDVLEVEGDLVRAQAWLWVDGLRIYHAPSLSLRAS
jgi:3-oxoacyl-(acyl-carrier-protein) synthase/3-hydroxymyristoyl/3-hydroxydecanoyl-(acyl carrier protein) dehydratase